MKFFKKVKENLSKIMFILLIIILLLIIIYTYNHQNNYKSNQTQIKTEEDIKLSKMDTDGDSINDYDEINKYKTDPSSNDTDRDGVLDNIELQLGTNINSSDTDGDGLLDGKAQYLNGKKIAPADQEPLKKNGLSGTWKKQIEIEKKGNIPNYLTKFYEYNPEKNIIEKINEINWQQLISSNNILKDINELPIVKEIGSKILMFRLDNNGKVLHSQTNEHIYDYLMSQAKKNLPSDKYALFEITIKTSGIKDKLETWQKKFGFNTLYDEVFRIATNNNMRSEQLLFEDSFGNDYVLWMWRGDYLALGSGAEIGLYTKNNKTTDEKIEHWDAVNFEVPMTLNLYNYYNENNIEHIFSWKPQNKQWWITGFNPNFSKVDVTKQIMIGTVDFSEHKDMYNSLKEKNKDLIKDYVIFDDDNSTIWINWYE